jgi:ABC-type sugar transport system ATPase subunit
VRPARPERLEPQPLRDPRRQADDLLGAGVVFITHNRHHAYPVGDRFVILNRGQTLGTYEKRDTDLQELVRLMAGGQELAEVQHELEELTEQQ